MSKLKIVVIYDRVLVDEADEQSAAAEKSPVVRTLDKKEVEEEVADALTKLGHEPTMHELDGTAKSLLASVEALASLEPAFAAVLEAHGVPSEMILLSESARTAAQAAAACGVGVAQIVKSLVFLAGDEPILVLVSGANQADERRLTSLSGRSVRRADAAAVRAVTGFAIGGVPPLAHPQPLRVFIDRDLLTHDRLIAAAGTPHAVFPITPADLCRVTGGAVADLKRDGDAARP